MIASQGHKIHILSITYTGSRLENRDLKSKSQKEEMHTLYNVQLRRNKSSQNLLKTWRLKKENPPVWTFDYRIKNTEVLQFAKCFHIRSHLTFRCLWEGDLIYKKIEA